nr:MAG TPA_asm: YopX protein [Caudoviricetes sp.]
MREILFRGKRTDNGEWTYGYYCPKPYSHFPCEATIFPSETIDRDWHGERVDPDTVGQFTGLTDKNGRKIFEGDIIEYTDGCNDWLGAVKYDGDDAQFVVRFIGGDVESFDNLYSGDCEVLGDIYDSPELLEVSRND